MSSPCTTSLSSFPFPPLPPDRRHVARTNISSPDNLSSGYSSSTAELSSFLPMSADEMMDTGDYELYNPRVQGFRNRETVPVVGYGFNKIYSLVILRVNILNFFWLMLQFYHHCFTQTLSDFLFCRQASYKLDHFDWIVHRSRSFALRGGGGTPVNTPGGVGAGRGRAPRSKQEVCCTNSV